MNPQYYSWQSPLGWISLTGGSAGIWNLALHSATASGQPLVEDGPLSPLLRSARQQIEEYFAGRRRNFDLPLVYPAWSAFALGVLDRLQQIPFGKTVTYGELATLAGHPGAARAVGGVMARNPFPLVIPCHRVIGAGGRLTGYSGGDGLVSKEWLLRFEAELARKSPLTAIIP